MEDNNCTKKDKEKEHTLYELKIKLLDQLSAVNDEEDVENIRKTVEKAKEINKIKNEMSAQESYIAFENDYLPKAERFKGILEHTKDEKLKAIQINSYTKNKQIFFKWKPSKIAFLSILMLLSTMFVTTVFAEIKIFEPLIRWTSEIFYKDIDKSSSSSGDTVAQGKSTKDEYLDFESIEKDYAISILKPYYTPEGYELETIIKSEFGFATSFCATYKSDANSIRYTVYLPLSNTETYSSAFDKSDEDAEIFLNNNIEFYVMSNMELYIASWNNMNLEYEVVGFETKDELIKFIKHLKI